jgi:hypothetical protein
MLLGEGDLADEVRAALDALGADVVRLVQPTQREVAEAFERGRVDRAVVVSRNDAFVLRTALMVRDADEDVELLLTYFDPATAPELRRRISRCRLTSMADVVAPVLAGPCLDESLGALDVRDGRTVGVRTDGEEVEEVELRSPDRRRARAFARSILRPHDRSAALLLYGALGLLGVLAFETVASAVVLEQGVVDAFYGAAKTLVTVDPNDEVAEGPTWFKLVIAIAMLVALVFEAFFTAGIVNRLIDRRLTGLAGSRAVPRRDHVVVVGLGQVGLRLCLLLRDASIPVVAVDGREDGENVGHAREAGLPVVIGRGGDPSVLRRLSLRHAKAVAAVTDDDLQNLGVAMAARAVDEDVRVVLRVGDGRLANETRSLFAVGIVRDVHRIAAGLIAAQATGASAERVLCHDAEAHLLSADGTLQPAPIAAST